MGDTLRDQFSKLAAPLQEALGDGYRVEYDIASGRQELGRRISVYVVRLSDDCRGPLSIAASIGSWGDDRFSLVAKDFAKSVKEDWGPVYSGK